MGKNQKVVLEYSSPNTNKPLHIGHVRNNILGMALSNLLESCGFEVVKVNLVNDRGVHICKSMLSYIKKGEKNTPASEGIKGDKFVGNLYVEFENQLREERKSYAEKQNVNLGDFTKEHQKQIKDKMKACESKEEKEKYKKELTELAHKEQEFDKQFFAESVLYREAMRLLQLWEQEDENTRKLWKMMNRWVMKGFETTYEDLGCEFDQFYLESDTYTLGKKFVEQGLEQGKFYKKDDGSIWVSADQLKAADPKAMKGVPIKDKLLLRGDGTSVYITQDIGTAVKKFEDHGMEHNLYVVADEQNLHFKNLFAILKILGFEWAKNCHHINYGMVVLPRGMGKIKSREGTAVDADDLLQEMVERSKAKMQEIDRESDLSDEEMSKTAHTVAVAALKVFMLQVSSEKSIQFDPSTVIEFHGDTGPFIQYEYARIQSVLRKATQKGINLEQIKENVNFAKLETEQERKIIQQLAEFPAVVKSAGENYSLTPIAQHLLGLSRSFSKFWSHCPILKEGTTPEVRDARLALCQAIAPVLKSGMAILGAEVPDQM